MARTPNDPLREQLDELVGGGVPQDVRQQHLAGIRAHATTLGPAEVTAGRAAGVRWEARRRVAALGAAGALVVPGVAVASQGSVPGDALFGVKKTTEAVVGLVDGRVAATNRIEELEALIERDAPLDVIADALERAAVAVAALDDPGELEARLSLLEARVASMIAAAEAEVTEQPSQAPAVAPTTPDDGPTTPSSSPSASEDDDDSDDDSDDDDRSAPSPRPSPGDDDDDETEDDDDSDDDRSGPSPQPSEDDDTDADDDEPEDDETDDETDDDEKSDRSGSSTSGTGSGDRSGSSSESPDDSEEPADEPTSDDD